jgi:hypothetical protein
MDWIVGMGSGEEASGPKGMKVSEREHHLLLY